MTSSTDNVSLDGTGKLRITPRRHAAGNWTSGRIETDRSDFRPPAGGKLRVEARLQMPNVTGAAAKYWPGFWMLGAPYRGNWWNWPGVGELDIPDIAPRSSDLFLAGGSQANHLQSTIDQTWSSYSSAVQILGHANPLTGLTLGIGW